MAVFPVPGAWAALAVDPVALAGSSSAARGAAAFLLVLVVGVTVRWRFEPFLERAVDASLDGPLRSAAYGVAAHLVVVFTAVLLTGKLSQLRVSGTTPAGLGVVFGVVLAVLAGAVGFVVVGSGVVSLVGRPSRWGGVVVGAAGAGVVAVTDPVVAAVLWIGVVSTGIGGSVRRFVHASAVDDL